MRRLTFLLVATLALAACGGSSTKTTTPPETGPSPAFTKQTIRTAYVNFFSNKTNVDGKVRLLQNGPKFQSVIKLFANNPLAKQVSVKVSSVTLKGANKAKVVYQVKLAGTTLPKQTGTAVRQGGTWRLGDASLCKLVSLSGSTPSACKP